jgi:hypothetical protein
LIKFNILQAEKKIKEEKLMKEEAEKTAKEEAEKAKAEKLKKEKEEVWFILETLVHHQHQGNLIILGRKEI